MTAIVSHTINFCWFFFKWSVIAALLGVLAASPFVYRRVFFRVEEEVRSRVEAKIAARFPHLEVRVRAAHLMGDGIEIRGLSISELAAAGPQPQLVYVDEMFLACQTSLQELASGAPVVTGVKLSRPVVRATRRPDGSFSIARLFPLPKPDRPLPPTSIEAGVIEIFDPLKNPSSTFTLRDVNLTIKPAAGKPMTPLKEPLFDVHGYLVSDQIQRMVISGNVEPSGKRWNFSGTVDGLELSPELLGALPQRLSDPLAPLASVRAPASLSFSVRRDENEPEPRFEINAMVARGRVENGLLPYPLVDLQATVHLDNSGIRVRNATAHHGATVWEVSEFDQKGYEATSPFTLRATARQVRFDRGWGNSLPEPWRTHWKSFDPEGDVNLDCTLVFDGHALKPAFSVTCLSNVSFSCHRFPYRLERASGTLTMADDMLETDVITAYSGAQPVYLKAHFDNPGPDFSGGVDIWGEKIQFDDKLFAALLKQRQRETLRSLNPRGTFNFHARFWREVGDPLPRPEMHAKAHIELNRCSMNYEKFPYPLSNVQGTLDMRDGVWTFPNLSGTNGTGTVRCGGSLVVAPEQSQLELDLQGDNVPLERELRDALLPDHRSIWDALEPYGSVKLHAKVSHKTGMKLPAVDLTVQPRGDATSLRTSIQPVAFPYRMEITGGSVHYRDGHAELLDVEAVHRNTQMRTCGVCSFKPSGGWQLRLEKFSADRLRLQGEDPELLAALPKPLRRAIGELRPSGPINLKGVLEFGKRGPNEPLVTGWNVEVFLTRSSVQVGPKLENVFGCVSLAGTSDGTHYASHGQLKLDSLSCKNVQFTQVLGPFWFDEHNVYLGAWPQPPHDGQPPTRITAQLYGGVAAADCHVKLGAVPQYHLLSTISGAELSQFARENLVNHQNLNGKVMANLDLHGSRGLHNLTGSGHVHVGDADVYELPLIFALLKVVSGKRPDPTAFTQSDIDFEINGEHVKLRQIDLRGDAVNLSGEGTLTLDGLTNPIKLAFHTKVGRGTMPIISGVFSQASQQIMTIHVTGPLDNPETYTEAFPVASQALERLRPDSGDAATTTNAPSGGVRR
jgi:hypothetical protein